MVTFIPSSLKKCTKNSQKKKKSAVIREGNTGDTTNTTAHTFGPAGITALSLCPKQQMVWDCKDSKSKASNIQVSASSVYSTKSFYLLCLSASCKQQAARSPLKNIQFSSLILVLQPFRLLEAHMVSDKASCILICHKHDWDYFLCCISFSVSFHLHLLQYALINHTVLKLVMNHQNNSHTTFHYFCHELLCCSSFMVLPCFRVSRFSVILTQLICELMSFPFYWTSSIFFYSQI